MVGRADGFIFTTHRHALNATTHAITQVSTVCFSQYFQSLCFATFLTLFWNDIASDYLSSLELFVLDMGFTSVNFCNGFVFRSLL